MLESAVFSEYHDMTLSLLIYPAEAPNRWSERSLEVDLMDTFEVFNKQKYPRGMDG